MANWYDNQVDLLDFAKYLHDQDEFSDADAVLYFFEKPWKWNEEWKEYKRQQEIAEQVILEDFTKMDESARSKLAEIGIDA